jgi:hypothetical protein
VPAAVVFKEALDALRNTRSEANEIVLVATDAPSIPATSPSE